MVNKKSEQTLPIRISKKNYDRIKQIKHKNMVESFDAALTIALGTFKKELKEAKQTEKDKRTASML